jgi:hypothetical protein
MNDSPMHDDELGAVLRDLDAPQHAAGFFENVRSEIDASPRPAKVRRLRPYLLGAAGTVSVAAAVLAAVLVLPNDQPSSDVALPTTTSTNPAVTQPEVITPLLASQVAERISNTYMNASAVSGTVTVKGFPDRSVGQTEDTTLSGSFALRADGSYVTESLDSEVKGRTTYDAVTNTTRSYHPRGMEMYGGSVIPLHSLTGLASRVRSLAVDDSTTLKEIEYKGKPAWQLDVKVRTEAYGADTMRLIADKELAFPLYVHTTRKGVPYDEMTVDNVVLNRPFDNSALTAAPKGWVQSTVDDGADWKIMSPEQASRVAGYPVLLPADVPKGFRLATVMVTKDQTTMGGDRQNEVRRIYRAGLASFTVSTFISTEPNLYDPLSGDDLSVTQTPVSLTSGPFAGQKASMAVSMHFGQRLWGGAAKKTMFYVEGDLSKDEMIAAIASLK